MTSVVLDASALPALLLAEPGAEKVAAALNDASIAAVNVAEVITFYAKLGVTRPDIEALLRPIPLRVVPIDLELSYEAGMLRPVTASQGLSLGDRYCLALAKREAVAALTADRKWPQVATAAGVVVDLIR